MVTAGVSCAAHASFQWCVGSDRTLAFLSANGRASIPQPVPGTSPVLAFYPAAQVVLLADGMTWRFDDPRSVAPTWRPSVPMFPEDRMKPTKDKKALLIAGSACGALWAVTEDRMVWTWTPRGTAQLFEAPVPGAARILAVDAPRRTVVLEDASRWEWIAGRWCEMPSLLDSDGKVRVRCLSGVNAASGLLNEGEERDVPEAEARDLIAGGWAERVA